MYIILNGISTSEEPYNIDVVTSDAGFAVKVIVKTL